MLSIGVTLVNHAEKAMRRYDTAARAGIVASSQHLLNELKKAYQDYYTTGKYRSTLQIRQSLRRANPEKDEGGWYTIVGVPTASVTPKGSKTAVDRGKVALFWEIGFTPKHSKTGRQWRVQIAVPAATEAAQGMRDAWARVVKRYMEAP